MGIVEQSIEKLQKAYEAEKDKFKMQKSIIAEPTLKALKSFCEQSEEFAQAVVDKETSFEAILNSCLEKSSSSGISDHEVYERAAQYFFSTAVIEFQMILHTSKYELEPSSAGIVLSLSDFI